MSNETRGQTQIGLGAYYDPVYQVQEFSHYPHGWLLLSQHTYTFEGREETSTYEQCAHCRCVRHQLLSLPTPDYAIDGTWTKEEPPCDDLNNIPIDLMGELTKVSKRW
jgi:hypothetical protein